LGIEFFPSASRSRIKKFGSVTKLMLSIERKRTGNTEMKYQFNFDVLLNLCKGKYKNALQRALV
jgi:hypothetical protein